MQKIDIDAGLSIAERRGFVERPMFVQEYDGTQACVMYAMQGEELNSKTYGKIFPTEEQDLFVRVMLCDLNSRLHHNGQWTAGVTGAVKSKWDAFSKLFRPWMPTIIRFIWWDEFNKLAFTVEIVDPIDVILDVSENDGFRVYLDQCEQAYNEWKRIIIKEIGVTDEARRMGRIV